MANMNQNGGGIGTMMQPKKKFKMQGGVRNYLGNQKQVKAPLNWQSSPDHPKTELAYITKKEKDLLVKKDLHGSLKGGVNRGPSGIMSLNGYGSIDSSGRDVGMSGAATSDAESGRSTANTRAETPSRGLPPGVVDNALQGYRDAFINAGAGQRVNPGFFDSRTLLSPTEIARAKSYRDRRNSSGGFANRFAKKSFRNTGQSGIMNFIKSGGFFGNLVKSLGQKFGLGKTYDDTSTRISDGFNNNLGLRGINNATYDFNPNAKINVDTTASSRFSNRSLGNVNNMPKVNVTGLDSNITSDQINEFGDGRSITSDQINEFGDNRNINIDEFTPGGLDRSNVYENFTDNRDLISEFATPGTMNQNAMEQDYGMYSGLPNQKLTNDAAMSVMMEGYNNSLPPPDNYNMGTEFGLQPAEGFQNPNALYDDFSNGEVAYYPAEHRLASITNNQLPGNNLMADVSANDLSRIGKYNENQDIGDIRMFEPTLNQTLTDQEIKSILDGTITEPTGQFARNGGIMGYGRG